MEKLAITVLVALFITVSGWALTITTATGNGADTYAFQQNPGGNYGSDATMQVKDYVFYPCRKIWLRFDISSKTGLAGKTTLSFVTTGNVYSPGDTIGVYGLSSTLPAYWDEWNETDPDGLDWFNGKANSTGGNGFNINAVYLGDLVGVASTGGTNTFSNQALTDFVNSDATGNSNGLITIMLNITTDSNGSRIFATKENTNNYAPPTLEILPPTINSSASQGIYSNKVIVSWDLVAGVEKYQVWRSLINDSGTAITNSPELTIDSFDDMTAIPDTYYYYWVKSKIGNEWGDFGSSALGYTSASTRPNKPTNTSPVLLNTVTAPVQLVASPYYDPGGYAFIASQWELSSSTNFSSPIWDSKETIPVNSFTMPANASSNLTNYWRVRYEKEFSTWSEWSDPTSFILILQPAQAETFLDTFNVVGNGNANLGYDNAGRQFGDTAPLLYTISGDAIIGSDSNNPGELELGLNSGVSPNYSFIESGTFKIEFDVVPHKLDKLNNWISLSFGKNSQDSLFPVSTSGAGLVFFCDGRFQAFDGTKMVGSGTGVPNDKELHIILTASTKEFDFYETQFSAFANGIPMKVRNVNSGYVYNDSVGYGNNYIALYSYNSTSTNSSLFDNLKISKVENTVSVTNWLSDSDMLPMNPSQKTHAVNLNGESVTINGVDFIGTGANFGDYANGSAILQSNGWELLSSGGTTTFHDGQNVTNLVTDTGTKTLMEHFVYFNNAGAIKLSGLSPFSSNVISIYSYGWEAPGTTNRFAYFSSTSGGSITNIDQDTYGEGSGIIVRYGYVADKNGECTIVVSSINEAGYHISGFYSEEIAAPPAQISVADKLEFGEVVVGIPATLQLEVMNIGAGIVSGSISGISAPFTLANSYWVTAATSDVIDVTFSPSGETGYSQTITLSGSGGNAQVELTGTGVPEPCLFIIYNLSIIIYYLKKRN